jgi:hypothetical protein
MKYWMTVTRKLTAQEAVDIYLRNTLIPREDLFAARVAGGWLIVRTVDDQHIETFGGKDQSFYRAVIAARHAEVIDKKLDKILKPIHEVPELIPVPGA